MKKKFIIVLGGGESGVGAALLAKKNGFKIFLSDSGIILNKYKKILIENKIPFEEKGHTDNMIIQNAIKVIKSPGISRNNPLIKKINFLGIPIQSELEFGKNYLENSYIIGITGSNGKTTTCSIIYQILKKKGINVGIAGNIGRSFSKEIIKKKMFIYEMSSFQLDDCFNFRSNIAVLLNITRDHLNRYDYNIENYIDSKFRIATFQKKEDIFIYNYDDPIIREGLKKYYIESQCIPFSIKEELHIGAYIKDKKIFIRNQKNKEIYLLNVKNIPLTGDHNLYNIMASSIISEILNVKKESVISILSKLKSIEHRMEKIRNINGIQFINDSKATNVNAVFYALKSTNAPIIWIAGGEDKGNNYIELIPLVKQKVKAIICLGKNNKKITNFFKNIIDIILETNNMKKAVYMAYILSSHGYNVLFSPACSSFDLFKDYKERGNKFKQEVIKLSL
ncbi:UDP-N-acetylmuramoylalanine--D-glutamate ligase [Blattabacterium sp. (Nauphoeta cinerea)]|uniref:UDP-N-acetylmuramoyl-L-alanine--D-glutamate ligase n=1 Tax=Blattabacterium sp. (Nauphoeta cinerea) TaxID=1316444 RepID=UPI0003B08BA7|nr:UDP-N-acetylmuramoyl-L-alanine--D-glutamate ligase [Blattabacterium sp. (Nauphoeta cinerea)]AGW86140.1 UDP-N-acetylmuramoylalanine--D-glutamate ligase [Blattabacterium sp. (Nauphoeta cinerea)]